VSTLFCCSGRDNWFVFFVDAVVWGEDFFILGSSWQDLWEVGRLSEEDCARITWIHERSFEPTLPVTRRRRVTLGLPSFALGFSLTLKLLPGVAHEREIERNDRAAAAIFKGEFKVVRCKFSSRPPTFNSGPHFPGEIIRAEKKGLVKFVRFNVAERQLERP